MKTLALLTTLGDLSKELGGVALRDITPEKALAGLKFIGFQDEEVVAKFLEAAKKVSSNDEETIMEFITGGGLSKLFSRQNSNSQLIVECTHCGELNFI